MLSLSLSTPFPKELLESKPPSKNFSMLVNVFVTFFSLFRCGHRGGYMELVGIDDGVKQELYKLASVSLCPNLAGQVVV